jgi:hypothetical protein
MMACILRVSVSEGHPTTDLAACLAVMQCSYRINVLCSDVSHRRSGRSNRSGLGTSCAPI